MSSTVGIDLGGTKISGVLMDENGKVKKKYSRPTEAEKSRDEILNNVLEVINNLKGVDTSSIGIGVPGFCNSEGKLLFIPNIPNLAKVELKKELEKKIGVKVVVENDANCFALAEAKLGIGKGKKNVVGVIIGTGVGGGVVIDGKIYTGTNGAAGEIGHTKIYLSAAGEAKSVENLIAGPALVKRYNELSGRSVQSLKEVWKIDGNYKKTMAEFVTYAGIFFANTINSFNPDIIVVGGGVSNINFYKDVKKEVKKHAIAHLADACDIRQNKLGDDAGVLGAAILARQVN